VTRIASQTKPVHILTSLARIAPSSCSNSRSSFCSSKCWSLLRCNL